jgi:GH25 family lysozyme M1 (1,4-beta-N-acetylmuramidase)
MNSTLSRRRGAIAALTVASAAGALLLGTLTPANAASSPQASPGSDTSVSAYVKAHDHQMGSELRAHEPVGDNAHAVAPRETVPGLDVSGYQPSIDWATVAADGAKFAYVKATESTDYVNPYFSDQYDGSYGAGLIRGSYHFAHPNASSGAAQADYFVAHGGGWSADGKTLPGALDIEWQPGGADCWGLSQADMGAWINDFVNEYHAAVGVWPTVYSNTNWWNECVGGNANGLSANDPLWLANYTGSVGAMPGTYTYATFWQYADSGTFPGDQDYFTGSEANLQTLATNG